MEEQQLQESITALTNKLREKKPEVYQHLIENPQTIPNQDNPDFISELKSYRETLLKLLEE